MCSNSAIYKLVFDQYLQLCKDHYLFFGIYILMCYNCYLIVVYYISSLLRVQPLLMSGIFTCKQPWWGGTVREVYTDVLTSY